MAGSVAGSVRFRQVLLIQWQGRFCNWTGHRLTFQAQKTQTTLPFDDLHKYTAKYTAKSLEKAIALNVLLLGLTIRWNVRGEKDLQQIIIIGVTQK